MAPGQSSPIESLYVHVPFCAQKCAYCAFYSEPTKGELINRYVAALTRELELVAPTLRRSDAPTIFFGGGTPSLLNMRQWEAILETMARLGLSGAAEWTIECNPATVSLDKARLWRAHGVNRISMGVQSLDERLLERLGRIHTRDMVFRSFDILRTGGFDNVNVDLMFAIPGQTMEQWEATLREAMALESEHLSCYEVIYEEDTPLYEQLAAGEFAVDEDLACAMYERLLERASEGGFQQYEVANFARNRVFNSFNLLPADLPTFACRHNVNYWRGGQYYGLGPSGAGFVDGQRTKNWSNTVLYCEQLEKGRRAIECTDVLPPVARAGEIAAFGLRMNAGWRLPEFERVTGYKLKQHWGTEMAALVQRDWAIEDNERFRLNSAGLRFADAVAEMFLK